MDKATDIKNGIDSNRVATTALVPGQFNGATSLPSDISTVKLPENINTTSADQIPTTPIKTPVIPPSTTATGLSTYVTTTADGIKKQMDDENAAMQKDVTTGEETDKNLKGKLDYLYSATEALPTKEAQIYTKNGVDLAGKNVRDLTNAINSENLSTSQRIRELTQNNPTGMSGGGLEQEVNRIKNDSSYRLANYGIALSAASGNWTAAQSIADRQIKAITDPLKTELDATKSFYDQNKASLDAKKTKLYETKINTLSNALKVTTDAGVKFQDAKNDAMKTLQAQGATSDQLIKIQSATTYDQLGAATGFSPSTTGAGTAAKNIASNLGIQDTTQPLSSVVAQVGINNVVNAIISNEGSSPKGVKNNPGNIKFTGLPGQTDSGIKAADGGTFASYSSDEEGRKAVADLVTNAATGGSSIYGQNVSFQDFANKYTNTAPENGYNGAPGTTGNPQIDTAKSGYASDVITRAGGLTQAAIDKAAITYAMTGSMPSIGLGSTGAAALKKNAIQNRAAELDANGQISSNKAKLTALTSSLGDQTKYQNTIQRSINTVDDNLKLLEDGATKVNKSGSPLINEWSNQVKKGVIGSGDLAAYKAAIQTVRSEYSNILARGGTVTDNVRQEAETLIPDNITKSQLEKVLATLRAEGKNVLDNANRQVASIQDSINNIIGGGTLFAKSDSSSGGSSYKGITLPN